MHGSMYIKCMKMVYACKHALLSVCRDVRKRVLVQYRVEVVHNNCFSRPHEDGKILSALLLSWWPQYWTDTLS